MGQKSFNAGVRDAHSGKYDPGGWDTEDYDDGWSYGKGQKHGNRNEYSSSHTSKKYDEGWQNGYDNYKQRNDTSCFITTACIKAKGFPDNCEELSTLRMFRDNWLIKQKGGLELVNEYYRIAPIIVESINLERDSASIYQSLWTDKIEPCYKLITKEKYKDAKELYCKTVIALSQQYILHY